MPYTVTLSASDKNVVMPNGLRYPGGSTIVLSDAEYAQLSPTFLTSFVSASSPSFISRVAATPLAGVALANGTPNILTWTAPNDGAMHRVLLMGSQNVGSTETGGQVSVTFTRPDASGTNTAIVWNGAQGAGFHPLLATTFLIAPNTVFTVLQATALTGGAATVWVEIWAS